MNGNRIWQFFRGRQGSPGQGEIDRERGAFLRLAFQVDVPVMFPDDAVNHGKAETRAFAHVLGREEWLKDLVLKMSRDSDACIRDGQERVFAGRYAAPVSCQISFRGCFPCTDGKCSPAWHCGYGVRGEVYDDLLYL